MMTTADYATIQTAASIASGYLTRRKLDGSDHPVADGQTLIQTLDAPEWMMDLVREGHRDGSTGPMPWQMSNDWRYEFIQDALGALEDHDDADAARDSLWDGRYHHTHEQTHWLHSRADRKAYCDDYEQEYGMAENMDQRLGGGMLMECFETFDAVLAYLEENADDITEE